MVKWCTLVDHSTGQLHRMPTTISERAPLSASNPPMNMNEVHCPQFTARKPPSTSFGNSPAASA